MNAPAPVVGEIREQDLTNILSGNGSAAGGAYIDKERLQSRLKELQEAEGNVLAELHAIQGAIAEISLKWLPWLDDMERMNNENQVA